MLDDLPDRIYEAGAIPELWPSALSAIADLVGAQGAVVFAARGDAPVKWLASPKFKPVIDEYFTSGVHLGNERTRRLIAANHPGFVTDLDVFDPEEQLSDPTYRQFWFRHGLGWGAATVVPVPSGDTLIFHAERNWADGPIERKLVDVLDSLRPHLARAALFSARLGLERARAMAMALQLLGLPGAVLRGRGVLHAANPLFEELLPELAQDRRDRLHLADANADRLFAEALAHMSSARGVPVNSIPIPPSPGRLPHVLHVLPVCGAARDVFSQATALVVITPIDRATVPGAEVLQGLFDLTPAEARIARAIGEAQTIEELAQTLQISRETVRTQLKAVLAKTGVSRQSELVSLLAGSKQAFR
jgi:DNA-binding CsgD family transcriptional regulator